MIAMLSGHIERATPGEVVVEVNGVGYRVHVPLSTYSKLPSQGQQCRLRVITVVREDEISLYGFNTGEEEELFRLLQGVTGVGPKLALKILSGMSAAHLRQGLADGDHGLLTTVPGVGRKLAQRLVVELRDKVGVAGEGVVPMPPVGDRVEAEALAALEALGYPRKTAQQALSKVRGANRESLENFVREALRKLAPRR